MHRAAPLRDLLRQLALVAALSLALAGPAGAHRCTGDCDASDTVTIQELIQGVRIALGQLELEVCYPFDVDLDGRVSVDELQVAIGNVFSWCGHGSPPTATRSASVRRTTTATRTPTTTPTATPSATASPDGAAAGPPSGLTVRGADGYGSKASESRRRRRRSRRDGSSGGAKGECG